MRHLKILGLALTLASLVAPASPPPKPSKDVVTINQKDYLIAGIHDSKISTRAASVQIKLSAKITLVSQEKAFLRAAINLDSADSFRTVFAKEVGRGSSEQQLDLEIVQPKQKIIRVVVWLDKEGPSSPPRPLASDNIAFDGAVFLNSNDR